MNRDPNSARILLEIARSRQREMISFIRALVEAESPSHDKAAVDRCGTLIAEAFAAAGARACVHTRREVGNILQFDFAPSGLTQTAAWTATASSDPLSPVLLLGHFDTVWELGTLSSMPSRQHNGRLFGPGVFDMKSGIAIALYAIQTLRESSHLQRPVTVLLNTDEEIGSEHSRELIEASAKKSAAVLVLEPAAGANGAVKTFRKGVGEYEIKVTGIAAHAGLDFARGHNAVLEIARQIEKVSGFTDLSRGLTVSVGTVRGGTRRNVVPAGAEAGVDVRIARAADASYIDQQFRALTPFDPACRVEVKGGINRPPLERTEGVASLYAVATGVAADLGFELGEAAVGGGSDGNFTAALGIPTLDGLGAVGEGAHAANESVVVDELAPRVALVAGLISRI